MVWAWMVRNGGVGLSAWAKGLTAWAAMGGEVSEVMVWMGYGFFLCLAHGLNISSCLCRDVIGAFGV